MTLPHSKYIQFWVLLFTALSLTPMAFAADKPNIVLILSDDQSWTDYGFMGHDVIRTPHLDRLADEENGRGPAHDGTLGRPSRNPYDVHDEREAIYCRCHGWQERTGETCCACAGRGVDVAMRISLAFQERSNKRKKDR